MSIPPVQPKLTGAPALAETETCIRIFEQEWRYVYRTLQRCGIGPADLEDLVQEVFLVMWRRRADWRRDRSLRPWLASVAFRVALQHRRRRAREIPGGLIDAEDGAPSSEERLGQADQQRIVTRLLASLPPKHRAVFVLHEIDGVPMKEVAEALEVPLFTAYSRLRVARASFAKQLRRWQSAGASPVERAAFAPAALLGAERAGPGPGAEVLARLRPRLRGALTAEAGVPVRGGPQGATAEITATASAKVAAVVAAIAGGMAALYSARPLLRVGGTLGGGALVAGAFALAGWSLASGAGQRAAVAASPARPLRAEPAPAGRPPAGRFAPSPPPRNPPLLAPAMLAHAPPAPPPAPDQEPALAEGLIGHWSFDEGPGSSLLRDASASGNDCQLHRPDSARLGPGVRGGAVHLGAGGWLECPRSEALDRIASELTISAWVRRERRQPHLRTIVARQHGPGTEDDFYLGVVHDQVIFASESWRRLTVPAPRPGRWFHLAAVRSATGVIRLYVDGQEAGRAKGRPGPLIPSPEPNPLLIGAAANTPDPTRVDQKLHGAIDELMLHERALGADEIAALAAADRPPR